MNEPGDDHPVGHALARAHGVEEAHDDLWQAAPAVEGVGEDFLGGLCGSGQMPALERPSLPPALVH